MHPILLDLSNRLVVVIGGGAVAERKIESLLAAGDVGSGRESSARVKVVSPEVTDRIRAWADAGQIAFEQRRYREGDLAGATLAYATTGDAVVDKMVRREATDRGVWLNVADDPDLCDFFAPAIVRRGALTVAISTAGASPALAARVRDRIDRDLPPDLGNLVRTLGNLRAECRQSGQPISSLRDRIDRLIDDVLGK